MKTYKRAWWMRKDLPPKRPWRRKDYQIWDEIDFYLICLFTVLVII